MPFKPLNQTQSNFKPLNTSGNFNGFPVEEPKQIKDGFLNKLAQFGVGVGKGIANTGVNLSSLGQRGLEKITGLDSNTPTLKQSISDVGADDLITPTNTPQKIGFTAEQIAEFLIPIGAEKKAAGAASKLLENAPKAVKYAGELAAKSATSAGTFAGLTATQGGDAGEVKKAGIIGAIIPGATDLIKSVGKGIAQFVIPTSKQEARLVQAYKAKNTLWDRLFTITEDKAPTTAAVTAFKAGIAGTESKLGILAKRESGKIWEKLISPALENAKLKVNLPKFFGQAERQIIKETPELSRQKSLLNALDAIKEDYAGVENITLSKLQQLKEGWAKFVPEKVYRGQPISGAFNDIKNTLSDKARQTIYTVLGDDVKQAYLDYGNLQGLVELGQQAMAGGKLKGGFGGFISAIKDYGLIPIGTIGGKYLYRAGKGVELYGKAGAKFVKDLLEGDDF